MQILLLFWILWFVFIRRCRKSICWVTFYVKDDFHINKGTILSCLNDADISVKKSTLTYFKLILSIFSALKTSTWSLHKLDKQTKTLLYQLRIKTTGCLSNSPHHYLGWQTHMETGLSISVSNMSLFTVLIVCEQERQDGFLLPGSPAFLAWGLESARRAILWKSSCSAWVLGDPSCSVITVLPSPRWRLNRVWVAYGGVIFPRWH